MKNELTQRLAPLVVATLLLAFVPLATSDYVLHIAIEILLWGFVYTAWSLMGKFGLVSLGHGAFLGIGAYASPLLWNYAGLTPWLGIPIGVLIAMLLALVIGYPCFRLRVIGHYFALVTLALEDQSRAVDDRGGARRITTGGSPLGMTPKAAWGTRGTRCNFREALLLRYRARGLGCSSIIVLAFRRHRRGARRARRHRGG